VGITYTEQEIDVAAQLASGIDPRQLHGLIPRGRNALWRVAHSPLLIASRVEGAPVRDGEYVYIPVIGYDTHCDAHIAIKFALTLGLRAGLDTQTPGGRDIARLHLVTGKVTEAVGDSGLRFHLGVAIQMR
jgi:hypothetical protein